MGMKIRLMAMIAAALLLAGCSREGFKQAKEGGSPSEEQSSSQETEAEEQSDDFVFEYETVEFEEENDLYYYVVPVAVSAEAEDAAAMIGGEIEETVLSVSREVAAGREYDIFAVSGDIEQNDGEFFSMSFDIEFSAGGEDERYLFGMTFDSVTGRRVSLEELTDPEDFVTLLLDEQASKVLGKDEELVAQKREHLRGQDMEQLLERLTRGGGLDILLDASFYIDGDKLVAVLSAPQQLGGVIEVSLPR